MEPLAVEPYMTARMSHVLRSLFVVVSKSNYMVQGIRVGLHDTSF